MTGVAVFEGQSDRWYFKCFLLLWSLICPWWACLWMGVLLLEGRVGEQI